RRLADWKSSLSTLTIAMMWGRLPHQQKFARNPQTAARMASTYPFEAPFEELSARADVFVDEVFASLESAFLVMPRGQGFVTFPDFENGYETLKQVTENFSKLEEPTIFATALRVPLVLVVLRTMLGFTPSEWAYVAGQSSGLEITQGFARSLDRKIRLNPMTALRPSRAVEPRVRALVAIACKMLTEGAPVTPPE